MDMSSLFPTDGIGGVLSTQPGPHVKFPAGIMTRDSESNRVTADPRKGTFQIITLADGLMHMQWQPRNSETAEEDLILFGTAETEMKLCNSCPDSARVYVLRWREGDQRMFFWMQGKDPSQDAANIALVNNLLEHGPDAQQV